MTADAHDAAAFVDEGGSSCAVGGRTFGAEDLRPLIFAPPGDVDGPIVPIDWDPTATDRTGKGCAVTHYGDLTANAIVVVRSGDCLRRDQVIAAQQAGATAFVAAYPGATAGVFSGASDPVSAEQAAASGTVAGRAADACSHQPCDIVANANLRLARVLAASLADFTVRVANNPELLRH